MNANIVTRREVLTLTEQWPIREQLQLITELSARVRTKIATPDQPPIDFLDLAGVGKEVWANIDTDDYINQERDSWEQ